MLDLKILRERLSWVQDRLTLRGQALPWETFETLDRDRRTILQEVEVLKHRRNVVSELIGRLKKEKKEAPETIEEMREVSRRIKELDEALTGIEEKFQDFLLNLPNIPHESVPVGYSSEDNPVVRTWGEKPVFPLIPRPTGISGNPWRSLILNGPRNSPERGSWSTRAWAPGWSGP